MPRDNAFDNPTQVRVPAVAGEACAPLELQGWCKAIGGDETAMPEPCRYGQVAQRQGGLPERDDLLGWSVILLTVPALVAGATAMVWCCIDGLL